MISINYDNDNIATTYRLQTIYRWALMDHLLIFLSVVHYAGLQNRYSQTLEIETTDLSISHQSQFQTDCSFT